MSNTFNTLIVLLSTVVCLTTGQWMPYLDPQNMGPFSHPMPDQMIVPKDPSTKIPIILLLKPKRAKSLSADTTSEAMERQNEADQPLSFTEWMGMPQMNSDSMVRPHSQIAQHMSPSEYGLSVEPSAEASEDDEVSVRSRGGEQIKWPVLKGKNGVTAEQLASISSLFPKLAAMSASNPELAEMANKNDGAFEEALKKFTSNLTDLEHRKGEESDKNNDDEDEQENSSESTIDSQSSRIAEALKSSQLEANDDKSDKNEEKSYSAEQRDNRLTLQKSRPFINDRNRIKIPVKSELNEHKSEPQMQTIVGQTSHKGWVPIPIKAKHKPKRKPNRPGIGSHKIVETHLHFPPETSPMDSQYLYHNSDRHMFGLPEPLNAIASAEPAPHMFRPRHFPHSYIPYDTKHTISHLPPYHKYNSYLTETELSPTLMQMTADANKPQHMDPSKVEEEVPSALSADKHKDIIDQKEGMIDKQLIDEKQMIIDQKHGLGEEILGQHLTCCDLLNGQPHPPHHVIHEEVIHKPVDFDDDKAIANMGVNGFRPEYPVHFGGFGGGGGSKYGSYPFAQSFNQKKPCHDSSPSVYPHTYWPQQVYRRPHYRPKLFYKPLLFG